MCHEGIISLKVVWVFNGVVGKHSGGVFSDVNKAENWIRANELTGMLTAYPLDQGVFDWAKDNDLLTMKKEKIEEKSKQPNFIGSFSTASQEHYHYENGVKQA